MCQKLYTDSTRADLQIMAQRLINEECAQRLSWGEIAPGELTSIVIENGFHADAVAATWGYPNECGQTTYIHARAETVSMHREYAADMICRRAIIPVTGYFVWSQRPGEAPRFCFDEKGDLLFLAGIWRKDFRGNYHFMLLTTSADGSATSIRCRVPLIIPAEFSRTWLTDPVAAEAFLKEKHMAVSYFEMRQKTSA
ncbi:MAG: SOS response-associated peptidase family protein [Clostridia bacterium]|nr:SOS response-associated peptidase family protein [Clostridia bacterium]